MKRYLTAAAAIALLAAACSAGSSAAATVNGTDISSSEVEGLVFETGEDFGDTEFTQLLEILVQWYAVADAAEQLGITVRVAARGGRGLEEEVGVGTRETARLDAREIHAAHARGAVRRRIVLQVRRDVDTGHRQ